jgi:phage shock protein E
MLFGGLKAKHDEKMRTKLPPQEVARLLERGALLVDVRSRLEAFLSTAPGATNIPLGRLTRRLAELPRDRDLVLYCGTGARAGKAKEVLDARGFRAFNGGAYKDVLKVLEGAGKTARPRG